MDIKPRITKARYAAAMAEIECIFDAEPGTPAGDRLEQLVARARAYEREHHPIPLPDPIEAIKYHMESRGLTRKDLEPYIGGRSHVSMILNRKRPLSLNVIRKLAELGIPAKVLIQSYPLNSKEP